MSFTGHKNVWIGPKFGKDISNICPYKVMERYHLGNTIWVYDYVKNMPKMENRT
jgi:hypothetical protein